MSLVAWFPLNGNLNNLVDMTNSLSTSGSVSASVTNDGKIGKTYTCTSFSSGSYVTAKTINLGMSQSMFCWVYFTEVSNSSSLMSLLGQHRYPTNSGMGITLRYNTSTTAYLSVNTGTGSARTYNQYCSTTLLSANTWYHVGYTFDNGVLSLYINGNPEVIYKRQESVGSTGSTAYSDSVLKAMKIYSEPIGVFMWSFSSSTIGDRAVYSSYTPKARINDVRIYNHALSLKEVKEISKALVLHYPFNDTSIEPTTNLLTAHTSFHNTALGTYSGINNQLGTGSLIEVREFQGGRHLYIRGGSGSNNRCYWQIGVTGSQKYTFSCDVFSNSSLTLRCEGNGGGYGTTWPQVGIATYDTPGRWKRVSYTMDVSSSPNLYMFINVPNGVEVYVNNVQLEEKDHATVYTKTSRTGVVHDNSGFGNHGVNNGVSLSTDSTNPYGKYTGIFESGKYIQVPAIFAGDYTHATWSFWIKESTGAQSYKSIFTSLNNPTGTYWISLNTEGAGLWYYNGAYTNASATISANTWYHVAITFNAGKLQWYLNGNAVSTTSGSTRTSITPSTMALGDSYTGGSWSGTPFSGSISDFRIYATALSATDIADLAKKKLSFTRNNSCLQAQLIEGNTKFSFNKKGIAECSEIIENPDLASGYTALEYIQSTLRGAHCTTGAKINLNTDKIELTFQANDASADYFIGGCGTSGTSSPYLWFYHYKSGAAFNIYADTGSGQNSFKSGKMQDTEKHTAILDCKKFFYDGVLKATSSTNFSNTLGNFCLFDSHTNNSGYSALTKIFNCKIWNSGNLARNLIPSKRNSDGKLGFFDLVTGTFYPATGTFNAGPSTGSISKTGNLYFSEFIEQ